MDVKVKLKLKNVEVELSVEEAKELKNILEGILCEQPTIKIVPYYVPSYPSVPWWPWTTWSVSTTTVGDHITYNCEAK